MDSLSKVAFMSSLRSDFGNDTSEQLSAEGFVLFNLVREVFGFKGGKESEFYNYTLKYSNSNIPRINSYIYEANAVYL